MPVVRVVSSCITSATAAVSLSLPVVVVVAAAYDTHARVSWGALFL